MKKEMKTISIITFFFKKKKKKKKKNSMQIMKKCYKYSSTKIIFFL